MLERHLPEQRLFLKSDVETRFIRLRPATQALAIAGAGRKRAMSAGWRTFQALVPADALIC